MTQPDPAPAVPLASGTLHCGDCLPVLARLPEASVDLTVTSPPYDALKRYDTPAIVDLLKLGSALFRVTKPGGVCALVIGDSARHFAKSLTSFRLAVTWCDKCGWRLFETCLYHRNGTPGPWWRSRFRVDHEYIPLFFKGERPATFHKEALMIPTRHGGQRVSHRPFPRKLTAANRLLPTMPRLIQPMKCRGTVWDYATSSSERNRLKLQHPATMPDALAADLIRGFSNAGDVVLDPLMGSGTTCVMAHRLGRRYLGMDVSPTYCALARQRLEQATAATLSA